MNSEQITVFLQEHWNWVTLIIGAVLLIGAIMNLNWLCDPYWQAGLSPLWPRLQAGDLLPTGNRADRGQHLETCNGTELGGCVP